MREKSADTRESDPTSCSTRQSRGIKTLSNSIPLALWIVMQFTTL